MTTRVYSCSLSIGTILWQCVFLLIYSCAIILVPPRKKVYRQLSVVALAYITYLTQKSLLETCLNPHWRGIGSPLLWIQFLSASELITISSVSTFTFFETCQSSKLSTVAAIFQGMLLLWNLRRIGTSWSAKNVPPRTQQSFIQFVAGRFLWQSFAYVLLDLCVSAPGPSQHLLQVPKQTLWRLSGLSVEDAVFRIVGSISFWITVAILLFFLHGTASTIGVILNLWQPSDCAPLFGSFREAYSLRKFWGESKPRRHILLANIGKTLQQGLAPVSAPKPLRICRCVYPFIAPHTTGHSTVTLYTADIGFCFIGSSSSRFGLSHGHTPPRSRRTRILRATGPTYHVRRLDAASYRPVGFCSYSTSLL